MADGPGPQLRPEAGLTFPPGCAYIGSQFVPMSEAKISVLDWGFLRSDATYDVVHVWKGRFFRLDVHIERFLNGIAKLRMELPFGPERLQAILAECVRRAELNDAYVEMILTRGTSPTFSRDPRDAINTFIAFAIPFGSVANADQMTRGVNLHVSSIPRIGPDSVDPTVKNYHWLDLVAGLYEAYDAGAENVLLVDGDGNLAEGPGFNVFAVNDDQVTTPDRGVLEGVTRRTALELLAELQVKAKTAPLSIAALKAADEVFITSTAGGVMPVGRIDGVAPSADAPGPLTQRLTERYWAKHTDPVWSVGVDELPTLDDWRRDD
ncbi:MAG: branched-chain amino acid transferase [Rhodospirillaceae bacterium]|nr:branched-chain amino acid transferase [Rhodospirillaceae bacterium]MBT5513384.1 branched-chain amino acid transferase [Rhodospirillaceae bacterium]MBT6087237.1 branched-chain amino acid transferase [Rhodospirillaceae bacterium]